MEQLVIITLLAIASISIITAVPDQLLQVSAAPSTAPSTAPTSSPTVAKSVAIGTCVKFSAFAKQSITFTGVRSTVLTGSLGVSPGTDIKGNFAILNGVTKINSTSAVECSRDLIVAYDMATNGTCIKFQMSNAPGTILPPGIYCPEDNPFTFPDGDFIFDGRNSTNQQWIFVTPFNMVVTTNTNFNLINSATENNIIWAVGGNVSILNGSNFVGDILSENYISFEEGAVMVGRALAKKAVTIGGGSSLAMPLPEFTIYPSSAPTNSQTFEPSNKPTLNPTYAPGSPTSCPTTLALLQLEVSQAIGGISITDAESEEFENAFRSSISRCVNLPFSDISLSSVDNFSTNRTGTFQANYTFVSVVYMIKVKNGNMTGIMNSLMNANFTSDLAAGLQQNGYLMATAAAVELFRNLSPTPSPTRYRAHALNVANLRIIIGSTTGVFGIVFIFIYFIYATGSCSARPPPLKPDDVLYSDEVLSGYEISKILNDSVEK